MEDALVVAVRFGLYAVLGLLFGVPAFALYGLTAKERASLRLRRQLAALAVAGVLLSALGLLALAAAMAGVSIGTVDAETVMAVIALPGIGTSAAVRMALLLMVLAVAVAIRSQPALIAASTTLGGAALATLAWSGHAAATEGPIGDFHLAADVVHLLAAGAWIGALVVFVQSTRARAYEPAGVQHRLTAFATAGTVLVGTLLLSGIVNAWVLVGPDHADDLLATVYGRALAAKLALFAVMLLLAALNRFRLAPRLTDGSEASRRAIRRSLALEALAGVAILAIAAWLGASMPPSAM